MLQSGTVYVSMSKEHRQSKSGRKLTVPAKIFCITICNAAKTSQHFDQNLIRDATCNLTYHFAYFLLYRFHILCSYFRQVTLDAAICSIRLLIFIINLEVPLFQYLLRIDICNDERDLTHLALNEPLLDLSQHSV